MTKKTTTTHFKSFLLPDVVSLFVLFGHPPSTKDSVLATIVDGGQVIC